MISSRRKGKSGELEVAALLRDLLGPSVLRNLTQVRDGGHDLIGIPGWAVEAKRACTPRVPEWWRQAVAQAGEARPGFEGQARELGWTLEMGIEVFAAIVREGL
jgi:hypothetical protein